MQRTLVALGCALALAGGGALAQQQDSTASSSSSSGSFSERAKQAAQTLEEKAKEAAGKVKQKSDETAQKSKSDSTQTAQSGSSGSTNDINQMQRQADAEYKSAKALCEPIQQDAQKNLCEKQATAKHANAEVDIAKAKAAAPSGTSAMGAGKSSK